jgi:hypothetical protein
MIPGQAFYSASGPATVFGGYENSSADPLLQHFFQAFELGLSGFAGPDDVNMMEILQIKSLTLYDQPIPSDVDLLTDQLIGIHPADSVSKYQVCCGFKPF